MLKISSQFFNWLRMHLLCTTNVRTELNWIKSLYRSEENKERMSSLQQNIRFLVYVQVFVLFYSNSVPFWALVYHSVLLLRKSCSNVCISSTCFTIFAEGTYCLLRSRIVERGFFIVLIASL